MGAELRISPDSDRHHVKVTLFSRCCLTLVGTPSDRYACTPNGTTSPGREHFRQWFEIDFKQQRGFGRGWLGGIPGFFHSQMLLTLFTSGVRTIRFSELLPWVHARPI